MRRNGQGIPSSGSLVRTHFQLPTPRAAAMPATANARLVIARFSRMTGSGWGGGGGVASGMGFLLCGNQLYARDHRLEIVPAGADDLRNVDDEKQDIAGCEKKVFPAGHF